MIEYEYNFSYKYILIIFISIKTNIYKEKTLLIVFILITYIQHFLFLLSNY